MQPTCFAVLCEMCGRANLVLGTSIAAICSPLMVMFVGRANPVLRASVAAEQIVLASIWMVSLTNFSSLHSEKGQALLVCLRNGIILSFC